MESVGWIIGVGWALGGAAAAFAHGKPALWRITIFLGPIAFLVFPPEK
jgi:hypothetical protein